MVKIVIDIFSCFIIFILHQSVSKATNLNLTIKWVEERDGDGKPINMDIYFDRVVMVCDKTAKKVINTGVLLDETRVLTSYNPFRKMVKAGKTKDILIGILQGRQYNSTTYQYINKVVYYTTKCYERVMKLEDNALTAEQWHGDEKQHSPVHDLYVIQVNKKIKLLDPNPSNYRFSYISSYTFTDAGPMITILAKRKDSLGQAVKFASLGFRDKDHINSQNETVLSSYDYVESNSLTDCDEWFIRDWGRFICIKNEEDYLGIGSGSVLIFKNKLFGIGSFTLNKGNVSIFVFTDIRTYRKEIFSSCGSEPANQTKEEFKVFQDQIESSEGEDMPTTPKVRFHLGRTHDEEWH